MAKKKFNRATVSVEELLQVMSIACYRRLRSQQVLDMARTAPFARVYVDSLPVRYQKILKELKRNVQIVNGQTAIPSDNHYATISVENLKSIIGDALYRQLAIGTLRYGYRANEKGERPVLVYSIPMECLSREARQAIGSRIERKRTGSGVTAGNSTYQSEEASVPQSRRRTAGRLEVLEQQRRNLLFLLCRILPDAPAYMLRPSELAVETVGDLSFLSREVRCYLQSRMGREYRARNSKG